MLTALFQLMNTLLIVAILIGIPYLIITLTKGMRSMEAKMDTLERLIRAQNHENE